MESAQDNSQPLLPSAAKKQRQSGDGDMPGAGAQDVKKDKVRAASCPVIITMLMLVIVSLAGCRFCGLTREDTWMHPSSMICGVMFM